MQAWVTQLREVAGLVAPDSHTPWSVMCCWKLCAALEGNILC